LVANLDINPFCGNFRVGGRSPGTRTVGVFLFGLVNERIGDNALIEKSRNESIGE
jgi:hypothetical protein